MTPEQEVGYRRLQHENHDLKRKLQTMIKRYKKLQKENKKLKEQHQREIRKLRDALKKK